MELSRVERIRVEDVLRWLLESEFRKQEASVEVLGEIGGIAPNELKKTLQIVLGKGFVGEYAGYYHLLTSGREVAVRVMRAHRLIETFLAKKSGVPMEQWHGLAHEREHLLSSEEVNRLADELGNPRFDPHGDPIPTREGDWPEREGVPIAEWPTGVWGVIEHVEDEPEEIFSRLVSMGIFAGMRFVIREKKPEGIYLKIEGCEERLTSRMDALLRVRKLEDGELPVPESAVRLNVIRRGEKAFILRLLPGCRGAERSRLLDLGFVPGSKIEHVLDSPLKGSAAYRVRGTLIALRKAQAEQVLVEKEARQ